MRRHMQNISFIAIIATLLSCGFFFSQQTQTSVVEEPTSEDKESKAQKVQSLDDVPDCSSETGVENSLDCYSRAADMSSILVDTKVDELLSHETESDRRMDFLESQLAWENSRDADCAFLREMVSDPDQQDLQEKTCLYNHNLDRLDELNETLDQFYQINPSPETKTP